MSSKAVAMGKGYGLHGKKMGTVITIDANDPASNAPRILTFGAVTVTNMAPDVDTLNLNVKAGRDALGRAREALLKPGVKLEHLSSTPKFRVDANDPKILIRELNGHIDRGQIVNGTFVPAE